MRTLMLVLLLAGCSAGAVEPEPVRLAFALEPVELYLDAAGDTASLVVRAVDMDGAPAEVPAVAWSSRNADVFTVDPGGHVTAHALGLATVEAVVGDTTLTGTVFVGVMP